MSKIKQGYKQTKVGIIPEDWEVVKLSEIFSKSFYGTSDSTNEIGKYPVLRMGNMQNGTLDLKDLVYLDLVEKEFKKYQLKKGDILLNRTNSYELVGKISLFDLDGDYLSASYIVAYRPNFKVLNSIFINNLLNTTYFQDKIRTIATKGVSQANINPTSFKEVINIPLPPLKEQEKIAEILTTWDEAITKQTELLRAKELQKKALMQKLLSGEVRFSGFSDEWEELRLGEIGEFKTSSIDKIINENERLVNLINYMDVYRNKHIDKNFRCSKTSLKEEQYEKVNLKKGDILFTPSSETPDDIGHSAVIIEDLPNTVYSYHLVRFRPKKSIDLKFSGYVFNNIDILKEFAKRANGSTRFTLSIKDFNETKAKFPSLPEQQKIAEVLSLADDEINLLKNELEELKLQKKALMQKLLTGQVRVKV
ncbi:restriction endonuclease subunit S [Arcobacter vandammei]|uniref:restriction endonuclease subunit S n=1 Tax=Arcobacter vandammei TaxID=2782243 RepID=UPI0018DF046A|nr:restriction endonuclease subunit S [Arcobacter vandammei]